MYTVSQEQILIIFSIFLTSLLGSIHCIGMCGPIVLVLGSNRFSLIFYHLGRLVSYLILGGIAFAMGGIVLAPFAHSVTALISPFSLGLVFLWMSLRSFQKRSFHLKFSPKLSKKFSYFVGESHRGRRVYLSRFFVGLLSFSLPCGWLYGVVIGATTTNNIFLSLIMMAAFWLGTVPMLFIAPTFLKKVLDPLKDKMPYLTGSIFLTASSSLFYQVLTRVHW